MQTPLTSSRASVCGIACRTRPSTRSLRSRASLMQQKRRKRRAKARERKKVKAVRRARRKKRRRRAAARAKAPGDVEQREADGGAGSHQGRWMRAPSATGKRTRHAQTYLSLSFTLPHTAFLIAVPGPDREPQPKMRRRSETRSHIPPVSERAGGDGRDGECTAKARTCGKWMYREKQMYMRIMPRAALALSEFPCSSRSRPMRRFPAALSFPSLIAGGSACSRATPPCAGSTRRPPSEAGGTRRP